MWLWSRQPGHRERQEIQVGSPMVVGIIASGEEGGGGGREGFSYFAWCLDALEENGSHHCVAEQKTERQVPNHRAGVIETAGPPQGHLTEGNRCFIVRPKPLARISLCLRVTVAYSQYCSLRLWAGADTPSDGAQAPCDQLAAPPAVMLLCTVEENDWILTVNIWN